MAKFYRITAFRNGHRRAGMAHSTQPVEHPASRFNKDQVAQLLADPRLDVEEVERDDGKGPENGEGASAEGGAAAKKAAAKKAAASKTDGK